jgi:mannose-6-phosphate isomerase-like protein (cupin superfamily)
MVPEAPLGRTEHGLVPAGEGWFVLNAREARWHRRKGRARLAFTGTTESEVETYFPHLGVNLAVLEPGEPLSMYHWEGDPEAFLVLAGEALLIVEGQERPLRQWDFVYCPPRTNHVIVGAGDAPCAVLAVGGREHLSSKVGAAWGAYTVDEAALRHGAGVEEETTEAEKAYARFPEPEPTRYRDGWLPG